MSPLKTEELNEYIFADLIHRLAQSFWKERVRKMENKGVENAFDTMPLVVDDLQQAIERLDWCRLESLKLLAKPRTKTFSDL